MQDGPPQDTEWLREARADVAASMDPVYSVDNADWSATIERVVVDPALHVFLTAARVHRDLRVAPTAVDSEPFVAAQITIDGQADISLKGGATVRSSRQEAILFRVPEAQAIYALQGGARFVSAGYTFIVDRAVELLGGDVPEALVPLLDRSTEQPHFVAMPASRTMRNLAASLFAPGFNGPLRRLVMEGAAYHLFGLQVAAVSRRSRDDDTPLPLSRRERDAVVEARRLLLADMCKPPTVGELALAVGLTRKRLNDGFRLQFGGTAFEILRRERMEHARIVLEQGGVTLKEAAFRVGYNHVTNFINAFRGQYGIPPRQYLKAPQRSVTRR
jgi:AraC-like DNA-binding protein